MIGVPEGKTDPRFATVANKEAHWPALLEQIERWTSQRSGAECEAVLMKAGVPCSRYRSVGEAMADPQVQARGLLAELGQGAGRFKVANVPYRLSATQPEARSELAPLGAHTAEVLQERLGLTPAQIDGLRSQGVFGRETA